MRRPWRRCRRSRFTPIDVVVVRGDARRRRWRARQRRAGRPVVYDGGTSRRRPWRRRWWRAAGARRVQAVNVRRRRSVWVVERLAEPAVLATALTERSPTTASCVRHDQQRQSTNVMVTPTVTTVLYSPYWWRSGQSDNAVALINKVRVSSRHRELSW